MMVFDRGSNSIKNLGELDRMEMAYVVSVSASYHRDMFMPLNTLAAPPEIIVPDNTRTAVKKTLLLRAGDLSKLP